MGKDTPFTLFDDEKVKPYLDAIEGDARGPGAGKDYATAGPDDDEDRPDAPQPTSDARVNVLMDVEEHHQP